GLGNTGFFEVFASRPLGLPISAWVMIALAILASILLVRSPFGRWLYASGSNERAAELSGVPVTRVKTRIYVIAGTCAGIVGLLQIANISSATADLGQFYELNAIAAVVIGGAALSGGRGTVRGTIIGAFVIGFLANGLVIVGVSPFWQQVITGAVIILAVAVDRIQQIAQNRGAARRAAAEVRTAASTSA
ncbi:MAG: ABC transporter permease, partial [Nocardioides sp.]|uniref:ABC transporter permease n=1 Tax=Nocardioides sp. TaxID=35761 RepID=UPI003D6BC655